MVESLLSPALGDALDVGASCTAGRPPGCINRPLAWRQLVTGVALAPFAVRAQGEASEKYSVPSRAEESVMESQPRE